MKLTTKEIAYLLPLFTERTAISLFSNIKATPDGTEHEKLSKKGIIQGNGYAPDALDMLMQIANPKRCARVIVQNDFCVIEKYTYRNDGRIILAENSNGEFVFSKLENFSDVIIGFSEFYGMSNIKTSDVSISLQVDEMILLLTIIDIYRQNTLLNYAGKTNQSEVVSMQEITNELSSGFENGLVKILINNSNYKIPEANDIDRLLASLVEKKCIVFEQGYKLTDNYSLLAKNFLIPESVVLFETFEIVANGDISVDGGLCVTAGIHDIISFVFSDNTIKLYSISAFQMLSTIENILGCPTFVQETVQAAPTPPPLQPINSTWQCACGKINAANFCSACGSKRV